MPLFEPAMVRYSSGIHALFYLTEVTQEHSEILSPPHQPTFMGYCGEIYLNKSSCTCIYYGHVHTTEDVMVQHFSRYLMESIRELLKFTRLDEVLLDSSHQLYLLARQCTKSELCKIKFWSSVHF